MSNDPDLIEEPCPDCKGTGEVPDFEGWYMEPCAECDGEGKR